MAYLMHFSASITLLVSNKMSSISRFKNRWILFKKMEYHEEAAWQEGRVPQDRIKYYRITPPPANWEGLTHVTALKATIRTFILAPKQWTWFMPSILDTLYNVYSVIHYVWESVLTNLCTRSLNAGLLTSATRWSKNRFTLVLISPISS